MKIFFSLFSQFIHFQINTYIKVFQSCQKVQNQCEFYQLVINELKSSIFFTILILKISVIEIEL